MTTWVKELRLHTSNVHQQVVTDIHCLKLLEIMNDTELLNIINTYQNYVNNFINISKEDLNKIKEQL